MTTAAAAQDAPATQPTTAPASAEAPAPVVTPAAHALLDKLAKAYADLKSAELAGAVGIDLDVAGKVEKQSPAFTATFADPNLFRHALTDDASLGGTGTKDYIHLPQFNVYYLRDVPAPTEGKTRSGVPTAVDDVLRRQNPSLLLALSPDPKALLTDWFPSLDRGTDATIDGVAMPTLTASDPLKDVTIVLDPQTSLLRRVDFDVRKQFTMRGEPDVKRATVRVDYTTARPAGPTDPAAYAWAPPDGAREATDQVASQHGEHPSEALLNRPAPAFTLKDVDGKDVSISDYRGKVVVVNFWATWCPPCMAELPGVQKIYDELKPKGVEVLAIHLQEEHATAKDVVAQNKWTFRVLLDTDGAVSKRWGGEPPPATLVVGRDGVVRTVLPGYSEQMSEKLLRDAVEKALAK